MSNHQTPCPKCLEQAKAPRLESLETAPYRIALVGNPNSGKSTIFNALTGSHQHTGNWPGKTIAHTVGYFIVGRQAFEIIDLPGTYSLSPYSAEEAITRDYLIFERPDAVIIALDAANLERNLYLAVQVMELGFPVVIALNRMDIAEARGVRIDTNRLGELLGAKVVPTVATRKNGLDQLVWTLLGQLEITSAIQKEFPERGLQINYGDEIEAEIRALLAEIHVLPELVSCLPGRCLAIKLLEGDPGITNQVQALVGPSAVLAARDGGVERLVGAYDEDADILFAERRYSWINSVVKEIVARPDSPRWNLSDAIDTVLTHRWLGLPFFFFIMWLVFKLTADISTPYLDWMESLITGVFSRWAAYAFAAWGLGSTWIESLFLDGILGGVGAVLVFIPVLMSLYFALAVLEESGYMSRAAFVMDRFMRVIGLHGKSFLPLMVGFGCSVPAIYATRTLENERDRILTGLLVPFMSCGARLPVYVLIAAIFFPEHGGLVIFGMYALGILTAILLGLLFKRTIFKPAEQTDFVLELPPYRMPSAGSVWRYMWERTKAFVEGAWTLILAISVLIWLLLAMPSGDGQFARVEVGESAFAWVSKQVSLVFEPLGFGDWEASGALISGFVAKEVVVATMSQVYVGEAEEPIQQPLSFGKDLVEIGTGFLAASADTLKAIPMIVGIDLFEGQGKSSPGRLMTGIRSRFEASSEGHGALAGFAFMVFVLLYTPCVAAVSAEKQELGTRWMWLSVIGQFVLAWSAALLIFQGGLLFGIG